jgi:hypothetical protein
MVTATATRPPSLSPGRRDRIFYSGMAIAMALTVFVGFARTYYLSTYFGTHATISGGPLTTLIHVHATLFTSWVLLFIIQTALVATHRVAIHRRLGIAGAVLAALMVGAGCAVAVASARRGSAPPGVDPLTFLAIPLGDMLMFTIMVTLAILLRRNKEAHKRLMVLAFISIIAAATARWPGVLAHGPFAFYGLAMLFVAAAATYDVFTRRSVHPAYIWGGAALAASVLLRLMISGTPAWHRVAETLVGR